MIRRTENNISMWLTDLNKVAKRKVSNEGSDRYLITFPRTAISLKMTKRINDPPIRKPPKKYLESFLALIST
jgi:hypothetical protein